MIRRDREFATSGGIPVARFYGPEDLPPDFDLPPAGEFPYTRGIHADMYRGRLWTMRQFSGFATPEETNRRYRYLLEQGQTGLSVAFDLPTLMGYDADHAAVGRRGRASAARRSPRSRTWRRCSAAFRWATSRVSMTINSPAAVIWAMYLAVAEKQGVELGHGSRARCRTTS